MPCVCVCVCVCVSCQRLNQLTDFQEIRYEYYVIWMLRQQRTFQFPVVGNKNM